MPLIFLGQEQVETSACISPFSFRQKYSNSKKASPFHLCRLNIPNVLSAVYVKV